MVRTLLLTEGKDNVMHHDEDRRGRWKRVIATTITALVLSTVPVLGILFLGSWQSAPAQTAGESVGVGLPTDFLTLDRPTSPAKSPAAARGSAQDNADVEVRLDSWEYSARVPTRFN